MALELAPDPTAVDAIVALALAEDLGTGDVTGEATIPPDRT